MPSALEVDPAAAVSMQQLDAPFELDRVGQPASCENFSWQLQGVSAE